MSKSVKILIVWLYEVCIPLYLAMIGTVSDIDIYFGAIVLFAFLPELAVIISPSFRRWIKIGVQNGEEKLTNRNLKEAIGHYTALNCIRVYVMAVCATIFKGVDVPTTMYLISFAGAVGIESLIFLKKFARV